MSREKRKLSKMADGRLPFVEKVAVYAKIKPEFKPESLIADDLNSDLIGYNNSKAILAKVNELTQMLDDISFLSGSEAYTASLKYYRFVKVMLADGVQGAQTVFDDLKQNFKKLAKKSKKAASDEIGEG